MEEVVGQTVAAVSRLDEELLKSYISNGGSLSKISENFEERPSQVNLLGSVVQAFNNDSIAAFEAGTGVGKSYAYLIPSMKWALANKEKVVVSTGTINLQQQLIEKDIPAAEKIIGAKVNSILLKGRQNYLCMRRIFEASVDRDLFSEEQEIIDKLVKWAKVTSTGSKSELTFTVPDSAWAKVNSESDACMGNRCIYHDSCFVMKVREQANAADVLVVNHHLLFADIESRMGGAGYDDSAVLPPYRRIVFDEAHGIESAATSFFSVRFTRFVINKYLNLLYRQKRSSYAGYIFTLQALSAAPDCTETVSNQIGQIKSNIINLETAAFDLLQHEYSLRLDETTVNGFMPVISLLKTLGDSILAFTGTVRQVMEEIDEDERASCNAYYETKNILRHLEETACACKDFSLWDEKQDKVFWIQRQRLSSKLENDNPDFVVFTQTPLDISNLMNQGVFEPMKSVVCTSATLQIANDFSYWMHRTGVAYADPQRIMHKTFASPFPYDKNVLFAVPDDIPFPESMEFQSGVNHAVVKLIKAAGGHTLVLFTSYESLRQTYLAVASKINDMGINLLKQGDDDRFKLLDNFKKDETSVLFATDSFWQGIDVPGDSLSQVIIVKLPFAVPSDPVYAARSQDIKKHGGNPFVQLSIPDAVIKFRQGFGRLVRRSTDKGAVVVLDRRIVTKPYGQIFMNSIPEVKREYTHLEDICADVSRMLQ